MRSWNAQEGAFVELLMECVQLVCFFLHYPSPSRLVVNTMQGLPLHLPELRIASIPRPRDVVFPPTSTEAPRRQGKGILGRRHTARHVYDGLGAAGGGNM
jgi:hypothetical protein